MTKQWLPVLYVALAVGIGFLLWLDLYAMVGLVTGDLPHPSATPAAIVFGGAAFGWFALLFPVMLAGQVVLNIVCAVRAASGRWDDRPISVQVGGLRSPVSRPADHSRFTLIVWQLCLFAFIPGWRLGIGVALLGVAAAWHFLVPSIVLAVIGVALVVWGVRVRFSVLPPVTVTREAWHPLD